MKIIIDECVPSIVKRGLPARNIVMVQDMGWAGIKNGKREISKAQARKLSARFRLPIDVFI